MDILGAILADPNVDPAFKRVLDTRHAKAQPRRFSGAALTGFGSINDPGSERSREVRDEELAAQRDDERFAAIWGDAE